MFPCHWRSRGRAGGHGGMFRQFVKERKQASTGSSKKNEATHSSADLTDTFSNDTITSRKDISIMAAKMRGKNESFETSRESERFKVGRDKLASEVVRLRSMDLQHKKKKNNTQDSNVVPTVVLTEPDNAYLR